MLTILERHLAEVLEFLVLILVQPALVPQHGYTTAPPHRELLPLQVSIAHLYYQALEPRLQLMYYLELLPTILLFLANGITIETNG